MAPTSRITKAAGGRSKQAVRGRNMKDRPGRPRRIARLTARGWVLLVAGAAAIPASYWLGRRELLYLGSFLALLPLLALGFVRMRRMRLTASRTFSPSVVSAGHPAMVNLEIGALTGPAAFGANLGANWRDTWPWHPYATAPAQVPSLFPRGPGGGRGSSVRLRYPLQPPARGVFEIGPILVDFSDPFGLADGALAAGSTASLIVTPEVVPFADDVVSIAADEGATRMLQRRAIGGADDLMTREYRRGDALRRVHWRASAHHGELMVRQEEQRSHAEARLLLDTRRPNYRDASVGRGPNASDSDRPESESFEWAVKLTASLGMHLQRNGFLVQVIETGPPQLTSLERPEEFLESLASVALTDESAGELSLLRGVARPDRSQGSVFAILSDAEPATVERLVAQRRSFDLAVAFLVWPRYPELSRTLTAAGWICVRSDPRDAVDTAWRAVGAEQEVARGHA